jgi:hypothetical protein
MSDTLLGVIIGGLLTSIPTIITFWVGKRSEERRHLRELSFQAAIDNWKHISESAKNLPGAVVEPLDVFLFHMLKLSEVATRNGLTPDTVAERVREVQEIVRRASDEATAFTKRSRESK